MILSVMNPDSDHIRDQILIGQEILTMESLTRLHGVPILKCRNLLEFT